MEHCHNCRYCGAAFCVGACYDSHRCDIDTDASSGQVGADDELRWCVGKGPRLEQQNILPFGVQRVGDQAPTQFGCQQQGALGAQVVADEPEGPRRPQPAEAVEHVDLVQADRNSGQPYSLVPASGGFAGRGATRRREGGRKEAVRY